MQAWKVIFNTGGMYIVVDVYLQMIQYWKASICWTSLQVWYRFTMASHNLNNSTLDTTCYSHPGKEMPKFYLASWREDSINLVCKVKSKSSKTWRSKSYSARNPISRFHVNFIVPPKKQPEMIPNGTTFYWSTRHRWNNHHRVQREYLRNDRSCRETGAVGVFVDELVGKSPRKWAPKPVLYI